MDADAPLSPSCSAPAECVVDVRQLCASHVYDHIRPLDVHDSVNDRVRALAAVGVSRGATDAEALTFNASREPISSPDASPASSSDAERHRSVMPATAADQFLHLDTCDAPCRSPFSTFSLSPDASKAVIVHDALEAPRVCTSVATDGFGTHLEVPMLLPHVHACSAAAHSPNDALSHSSSSFAASSRASSTLQPATPSQLNLATLAAPAHAITDTRTWTQWSPDSKYIVILQRTRPRSVASAAGSHDADSACVLPSSVEHAQLHNDMTLCVWDVNTHTCACVLSTSAVAPTAAPFSRALHAWRRVTQHEDDVHDMVVCACVYPAPGFCIVTLLIVYTHGWLQLLEVGFQSSCPRQQSQICLRGCTDDFRHAALHLAVKPQHAQLPSSVYLAPLVTYELPAVLRTVTGVSLSPSCARVSDGAREHAVSLLLISGLPRSTESSSPAFNSHAYAACSQKALASAPGATSLADPVNSGTRVILALRLDLSTGSESLSLSSEAEMGVDSTNSSAESNASTASWSSAVAHPSNPSDSVPRLATHAHDNVKPADNAPAPGTPPPLSSTACVHIIVTTFTPPRPTIPPTAASLPSILHAATMDAMSLCATAAAETGVLALVQPATPFLELRRADTSTHSQVESIREMDAENGPALALLQAFGSSACSWTRLETRAHPTMQSTAFQLFSWAHQLLTSFVQTVGVSESSRHNSGASCCSCCADGHVPLYMRNRHDDVPASECASTRATMQHADASTPLGMYTSGTAARSSAGITRDHIAISPHHDAMRAVFAMNSSRLPASAPPSLPFLFTLTQAHGHVSVCALCIGDAASLQSRPGFPPPLAPFIAVLPLEVGAATLAVNDSINAARFIWWDDATHILVCNDAGVISRVRALPDPRALMDEYGCATAEHPPHTTSVWSPAATIGTVSMPPSMLSPFVAAMPTWNSTDSSSCTVIACMPMASTSDAGADDNTPTPIIMILRASVAAARRRLRDRTAPLSTMHAHPSYSPSAHQRASLQVHASVPLLLSRFSVDDWLTTRVRDDAALLSASDADAAVQQLSSRYQISNAVLLDSLRARAWMDSFAHVHADSRSDFRTSQHTTSFLSDAAPDASVYPTCIDCTSTFTADDITTGLAHLRPHVYTCIFITAIACAPTRVSTQLLLRLQRCMPVMHDATLLELTAAAERADPHAWGRVRVHAPRDIQAAAALLSLALTQLFGVLAMCADGVVAQQLHATLCSTEDESGVDTHSLLHVAHTTLLTRAARTAWIAHAMECPPHTPLHMHGREWQWYVDAHALTAAWVYASGGVPAAVADYSQAHFSHLTAWPVGWTQSHVHSYSCRALHVLMCCAHDDVLPFRLALLARALRHMPLDALSHMLPTLPAPNSSPPRARLMSAETGVPSAHVLIDVSTWKRVPPRSRNHTRADSHAPVTSPGGTARAYTSSEAAGSASNAAAVSISATSALLRARARAHGTPRAMGPASPRMTERSARREPATPHLLLRLPVGDADTYAQTRRAVISPPGSPSQPYTLRKMTLDLSAMEITPVDADDDSTPATSRKHTRDSTDRAVQAGRVPPSPSLYARHLVPADEHNFTGVAAAVATTVAGLDWSSISRTRTTQLLPLHVTEHVSPDLLRNEFVHVSIAVTKAIAASSSADLVEHACVCSPGTLKGASCTCEEVQALSDDVAAATGMPRHSREQLTPLMPPHTCDVWLHPLRGATDVDFRAVYGFLTSPLQLSAWFAVAALRCVDTGRQDDAFKLLTDAYSRFEYDDTSRQLLTHAAEALAVCCSIGISLSAVSDLTLRGMTWSGVPSRNSMHAIVAALTDVERRRLGDARHPSAYHELSAVDEFIAAQLSSCSTDDVIEHVDACLAADAHGPSFERLIEHMHTHLWAHIRRMAHSRPWRDISDAMQRACAAMDLLSTFRELPAPAELAPLRRANCSMRIIHQSATTAVDPLRTWLLQLCSCELFAIRLQCVDDAVAHLRPQVDPEHEHWYDRIVRHRSLPPRHDRDAVMHGLNHVDFRLIHALTQLRQPQNATPSSSSPDVSEQHVVDLMQLLGSQLKAAT